MKNFFKKMKTYSFWVSFSGALIILINALGRAFGFKVENKVIEDCIMSIAGILVVLGVVIMGDKKTDDDRSGDDVLDENEEKSDSENDKTEEKIDEKIETDLTKKE